MKKTTGINKEIAFDHEGGPLWINIVMEGLFFMTYTYRLWSAKTSELPILTTPTRAGNNERSDDDNYQVLNDFKPNEPVTDYTNRVIDVRFWVKKGEDAEEESEVKYTLKVVVLQGSTFKKAVELRNHIIEKELKDVSLKQEFITIRLK